MKELKEINKDTDETIRLVPNDNGENLYKWTATLMAGHMRRRSL